MKATMNRIELNKAMTDVKRAIPRTKCLPALQNIHIMIERDTVTITGTDIDNTVSRTIDAYNTVFGVCLVNYKQFAAILKNIKTPEICIEIDGEQLTINDSLSINTGDCEEYPNLPIEGKNRIANVVLTPEIIESSGIASKFVAKDMIRRTLTGVNFECDNDTVTITGTDGYRLYNETLSVPPLNGVNNNFISSVFPIAYISKHKKLDWSLAIYEDRLLFTSPGHAVSCKLIDGPFPNYKAIMPVDFEQEYTINRENLLNAVTTVLPAANKITNSTQLHFTSTNEVKVITVDTDRGISGKQVIAASIKHPYTPFRIDCSGKFMLDALTALSGETVTMKTNGIASAMVFIPETGNMTALLMPLRQ